MSLLTGSVVVVGVAVGLLLTTAVTLFAPGLRRSKTPGSEASQTL